MFRKISCFTGIIIILSVLLLSCTIKQDILINSNGSGSFSGEIVLHEMFINYISSLEEIMKGSKPEEGQLFKIEEIRSGLELNPDIKVVNISTPDPNTLSIKFNFTDIEKLLTGEEAVSTDIISFTTKGEIKTLAINLNRDNFHQLYPLFPILKNPLFEALGPIENSGLTEEEYLEMMEYAMGEESHEVILQSYIKARITINGTLISQKGGEAANGTVLIKIPLIKMLLLEEPLNYLIVFK